VPSGCRERRDRASGYHFAKQQLFRTLDDVNPNPELAKLENYVMEKANTLGIGTMGSAEKCPSSAARSVLTTGFPQASS